MERDTSKDANGGNYLLLALLSIIWGTSYILIKKGLIALSPMQLAGVRLTVTALAFMPWLLFRLKKIAWSKWKYLLIVGLMGSGIPSFLYALAQTKISSSVTGILNSFTPLATLVIGIFVFGSSFRWNKFFGVALGLAGALLLLLYGEATKSESDVWYGLLVVIGAVCYAISANVVGHKLQGLGSISISALSFFLTLPLGLSLVLLNDTLTTVCAHPQGWESFGYTVLLALSSTVFASVLYFRLIQNTSAVFASFVSYFMPIVALFWGAMDGEAITLYSMVGMGLILGGVYIAKR